MPRKPIDYSKTIIYRIVCNDINIIDCYVGHTTNFINRRTEHKSCCNKNNKNYVYEFIRNNGGFDNWNMVEIEKYEAIDVNDAKKRERYWIEYYKSSLNKSIPLRTKQEYNIDNKEELSAKKKEYKINNKEEISKKNKEYKINNADKIKEYNLQNKDKIKQQRKDYYNKNRENLLIQKKQYYIKNKIT